MVATNDHQPSPTGRWWSLHTHSKFSVNDALSEVADLVERAVQLGYPALGLTDHGSPSGNIQLYTACRAAHIEPLPGMELYVMPERASNIRSSSMHLTVAAYSEAGYRNLVYLATRSAARYWYKPLVDFSDLAEMAEENRTEGLLVATGCYGGVVPRVLREQGPAEAKAILRVLDSWFPRVYVELMNHGIEDFGDSYHLSDEDMVQGLWQLAVETGIPPIITRDSHYTNRDQVHLHDGLKRLVTWSDDVDDAPFKGTGYWMADEIEMRDYFGPKVMSAALDSLAELATKAYVRIPELETFKLHVPDITLDDEDPQEVLEAKVMAALDDRQRHDSAVMSTIHLELDTLRVAGYAPYILLVDIVCQFMREQSIRYITRGSAASSYVNYVLGISDIDPLRFGLRFDRFLSSNRMKPPDVDLDVEYDRRDEVISFIRSKWAVRAIGSHMKYSLFETSEGEDSMGSLRVKYYAARSKQGLDKILWREIPAKDRALLNELGKLKLVSGYGSNASGFVVAPTDTDARRLPLAYISSSAKFVTAYGKKDVEKMGFLKLDLLGSRTQTALRATLATLPDLDWDAIPERDPETASMISAGKVDGVFQLSGVEQRRGCRTVRPRGLTDVIAIQALYRPATRRSGAQDDWRRRRAKLEPVPVRHADIMAATKESYGVLLYQEQVMDVMQALGMDRLELEQVLDAVKASNEYTAGAAATLEALEPRIRTLAGIRHWSDVDIEWLIDTLAANSDYSFNKAHAAVYGTVAWRHAWLKCHHPVEFWYGMLLAHADDSKKKGQPHPAVQLSMSARRDGVKLLSAHVNHSKPLYTIEALNGSRAIRRGLKTIRGVGDRAATELAAKAPFASLKDLGERVAAQRVTGAGQLVLGKKPEETGKTMIAALADANALDGLE